MAMRVAMDIPAARASQIAQLLAQDGLGVSWEAPIEKASGGLEGQLVHIVFWLKDNAASGVVGGAAYAAASEGVRRVRERFPGLEVQVEGGSEGAAGDEERAPSGDA